MLDEPTSALDVLVQARVLQLLDELRHRRNLTYVFITHDLGVVRNIADRVAVFERGNLVEEAGTEEIFERPANAYTRSLIGAIPIITDDEEPCAKSHGENWCCLKTHCRPLDMQSTGRRHTSRLQCA